MRLSVNWLHYDMESEREREQPRETAKTTTEWLKLKWYANINLKWVCKLLMRTRDTSTTIQTEKACANGVLVYHVNNNSDKAEFILFTLTSLVHHAVSMNVMVILIFIQGGLIKQEEVWRELTRIMHKLFLSIVIPWGNGHDGPTTTGSYQKCERGNKLLLGLNFQYTKNKSLIS